MSELYLQAEPLEQNMSQEALRSDEILSSIERRGVNIENREGTAGALDLLRQEFDIADEAFTDVKRSLVLTAAAGYLAAAETDTVGKRSSEMEYVADIVMEIAGEYTAFTDVQQTADAESSEPSEAHQKQVYEKYTHSELTKSMDEFIRGEALDGLRTRLGITEEQAYEVRVLSIDDGSTYFTVPNVELHDDTLPPEEIKTRLKEQEYRSDYKKGLVQRTKRFAQELGREELFAPAWVRTFEDGVQYLCLAAPLVERVLYPDEERPNDYKEGDRARDLATIQHEYVHTQGMITEGKVGLGIALEELRAEHFSGNKHGYIDIKRFFMGMKMVTGYNPTQSFEINNKAYSEEEFLTDIARNVGLDGLLDCMAAIPQNYVKDEEASPFVKAMAVHDGSLSGILQRVYDRTVKHEGVDVVKERVSTFVDSVHEATSQTQTLTVKSWFAYPGIKSLYDIGMQNYQSRYDEEGNLVKK